MYLSDFRASSVPSLTLAVSCFLILETRSPFVSSDAKSAHSFTRYSPYPHTYICMYRIYLPKYLLGTPTLSRETNMTPNDIYPRLTTRKSMFFPFTFSFMYSPYVHYCSNMLVSVLGLALIQQHGLLTVAMWDRPFKLCSALGLIMA